MKKPIYFVLGLLALYFVYAYWSVFL